MLLELKITVKGTVQTNVIHSTGLFVFMYPLDDLPLISDGKLEIFFFLVF